MVVIPGFKAAVSEEVSTILAPGFVINLTSSSTVPHSDGAAITFPNLEGFRATVNINEAGGMMVGTLRAQIYEVSRSNMKSITTLQWKPPDSHSKHHTGLCN